MDSYANNTLAWTGQELTQCSLYGIRIYEESSVLATNVDRLPSVSSAIINVAQDVDKPWPMEVIGHNGVVENVTMEPGDMVVREPFNYSWKIVSAERKVYANVFIHFEPMQKIGGQVEYTGDLPPYLIPGSEEETNWRSHNPEGHKVVSTGRAFNAGSSDAHDHPSPSRFSV